MDKTSIQDLSRQALVRGTSCFTDPEGNRGFKNEDLQVSALVRIADALEKQNGFFEASRAGFTVEQQQDGLNHYESVQEHGSRLVEIKVLGSSPEMAKTLADKIAEVIRLAIEKAEKGGQADG